MTKIRSRVILITPSIATKLLEGNTGNRKVIQSTVDAYVVDLLNSRWALNGETIKVSNAGRLLDGQHRLLAIIKANRAVECVLVEGLEESSFSTIDTGVKRTAAHIARMTGMSSAAQMTATAGWFIRCLENQEGKPWRGKISPAEILATIDASPTIEHAVHTSVSGPGKFLRSPVLGTLAFAMTLYGTERIDGFIAQLVSGENLKQGDPALALRERLLRNTASFARLEQRAIASLTVKAINAFVAGRTIGTLRMTAGEVWPIFERKV